MSLKYLRPILTTQHDPTNVRVHLSGSEHKHATKGLNQVCAERMFLLFPRLCHLTVKEIRALFLLENKQLYCHYKQEETLLEMYHKNLK